MVDDDGTWYDSDGKSCVVTEFVGHSDGRELHVTLTRYKVYATIFLDSPAEDSRQQDVL